MDGYVTTKQLALKYQVTEQTIYNWRQEGLPYIKLGRAIRFDPGKVQQWFEDRNKLPFEE